jgi:hypothetical protein
VNSVISARQLRFISYKMQLLQNWWERVPFSARLVLFVASLLGMVLGGSAGGYWD